MEISNMPSSHRIQKILRNKPGTKVSKIINKKNSATKKKEKRIM